jgi:hypothetical protein
MPLLARCNSSIVIAPQSRDELLGTARPADDVKVDQRGQHDFLGVGQVDGCPRAVADLNIHGLHGADTNGHGDFLEAGHIMLIEHILAATAAVQSLFVT